MFFRRSLPEEIACAEVLSAIALLLYRETAAISTVDRSCFFNLVIPSKVEGPLTFASVSEETRQQEGKIRGSSTPLRFAQNDKKERCSLDCSVRQARHSN